MGKYLGIAQLFTYFAFSGTHKRDCQLGDGISDREEQLSGTFDKENCIIAVREQHPTANGATTEAHCTNECQCWAKFGMKSWSGTSYQACMFYPGEYSSSPSHCRMRDESSMFSSPEFKNLIFLCSF